MCIICKQYPIHSQERCLHCLIHKIRHQAQEAINQIETETSQKIKELTSKLLQNRLECQQKINTLYQEAELQYFGSLDASSNQERSKQEPSKQEPSKQKPSKQESSKQETSKLVVSKPILSKQDESIIKASFLNGLTVSIQNVPQNIPNQISDINVSLLSPPNQNPNTSYYIPNIAGQNVSLLSPPNTHPIDPFAPNNVFTRNTAAPNSLPSNASPSHIPNNAAPDSLPSNTSHFYIPNTAPNGFTPNTHPIDPFAPNNVPNIHPIDPFAPNNVPNVHPIDPFAPNNVPNVHPINPFAPNYPTPKRINPENESIGDCMVSLIVF